jgi:glutamate racemase
MAIASVSQNRAHTSRGNQAPLIGFFDSGVGGLAVLAEVARQLPHHRLLYYADAAHFPYGGRADAEIVERSHHAARFLIERGAEAIVVACNTASTAALASLRRSSEAPFIGVVPAVKPAAALSKAGSVAILATDGTLQSRAFDDLVKAFAVNVEVIRLSGAGLADQVERGALSSRDTLNLLERCLAPARMQAVDVLVLGCTHYSFLRPAIEQVLGPSVTIIDCTPAVAAQVARVVGSAPETSPGDVTHRVRYVTSGDRQRLAATIDRLRASGAELPFGPVCDEQRFL